MGIEYENEAGVHYVFLCDEYSGKEAAALIKKNKVPKVIMLSLPSSGEGLAFLAKCASITNLRLSLEDSGEFDISPIYQLPNLEKIEFGAIAKEDIDFSKMPNIRNVIIDWSSALSSIFHATQLKSLHLQGISTVKITDLSFLSELKNLEELHIAYAKCQSLSGVESLKKLRVLHLESMPKLTDIAALAKLKLLDSLGISNCNKIVDIHSTLEKLTQLQTLGLKHRKIQSVDFVRKLRKLKVINFTGSSLIDGDLTPFLDKNLNLERVVFSDRSQYSHTFMQMHDLLHPVE